jgi:hypothetical protein
MVPVHVKKFAFSQGQGTFEILVGSGMQAILFCFNMGDHDAHVIRDNRTYGFIAR